jgi:glyoxylase-like metal-dependent hydrolase (beta-lactamase superfamily II)
LIAPEEESPVDHLIAPGLRQIDTRLGGWEELNSVFLIEAPRPCLVETGPQLDAGKVLAALDRMGLGRDELAYVVLTHIHLDHGGGVGEIAASFPKATVVCHPRGLRHLADPSRLVAAAAQVYGPELDSLYGRMTAVDSDRLLAAEDMGKLSLGGGRHLTLVDSPGHAKHHIGVLDDSTGVLLVGDAVGVKVTGGGPLRPATPPDDFELDLAVGSLHRFAELAPSQLVLTHFGSAGEPQEVLAEAEATMTRWAQIAEHAFSEEPTVDHIAAALLERAYQPAEEPARQPVVDTLNGVLSNSAGLHGWLSRRRARGAEDGA